MNWGYPLRQIYEELSHKVRNWLALVNLYLLLDTIEVGGGTEESIETLAEFSEATKLLEKEKRAALMPLILVPYRFLHQLQSGDKRSRGEPLQDPPNPPRRPQLHPGPGDGEDRDWPGLGRVQTLGATIPGLNGWSLPRLQIQHRRADLRCVGRFHL